MTNSGRSSIVGALAITLTATPLIGIVAASGGFVFVTAQVGPMVLGAILGGLMAQPNFRSSQGSRTKNRALTERVATTSQGRAVGLLELRKMA
jgi:hypothetical protein